MCGIAGVFSIDPSQSPSYDVLRAMAQAISHRGPDAEGVWAGPGIGLAHRRLSIIDLSGGDQPIENEDGTLKVIFNGEIYNYRHLRDELIVGGHRFRTESDTEVLVHLYEEFGVDLALRLRGMFAFAIWDSKRRRLLLVRDRIGLKPLYYFRDGEKLIFGSEIKAILAYPGVPKHLDIEALADYLANGFVSGERSGFCGIRKLRPGHSLTIEQGRADQPPHRYWSWCTKPDETRTVGEWMECLDEKIGETIRAHMIADVPVGAFLSGGIDSSAIVSTASIGRPLKTFSIGFSEGYLSELPYARLVAKQFGTDHYEEIVTADALQTLDELVYYFDEPFADSSAIPMLALSRLARQHVKVVLSGDGGDEAFGGYSRYAHDLFEARIRRWIPAWVRTGILRRLSAYWPEADWLPRAFRAKTVLTNLSLPPAEAYANTLSVCRPYLRRDLLLPEVQRSLNGFEPEDSVRRLFIGGPNDPLRGMISTDLGHLLPDDFLTKVDRTSMAVGLEVRAPFVDHELLEMAGRIPSTWKIRQGETKWLLKQLYQQRLPSQILRRRKQGFDVPLDRWLRGPLRELFVGTVLSPSSQLATYFDRHVLQKLYQEHQSGRRRNGQILWSLLVLDRWMQRFFSPPLYTQCGREEGEKNKSSSSTSGVASATRQ